MPSPVATIADFQPLPDGSGFRLRETGRYFIDVLSQLGGNFRVVTTPKADPRIYERGWCYHGGLLVAVVAASVFDPDEGEEPTGWVKEVATERRPCASYPVGPREHTSYVADCPACGDEGLYR